MFDIELKDIDVLSTIDKFMSMSFGPFLMQEGKRMADVTRQRMARGVDPNERAYAPNTGLYGSWKEKKYPGKPPLTLTGELGREIQPFLEGNEVSVWVPPGLHAKVPGLPKFVDQDPRDFPSIVEGHELGNRGAKRIIFGMNEKDIQTTYDAFCRLFEPEFS